MAVPLAPVSRLLPPPPQIMFTSAFNPHHCHPCGEQVSADCITSSVVLLKGEGGRTSADAELA